MYLYGQHHRAIGSELILYKPGTCKSVRHPANVNTAVVLAYEALSSKAVGRDVVRLSGIIRWKSYRHRVSRQTNSQAELFNVVRSLSEACPSNDKLIIP